MHIEPTDIKKTLVIKPTPILPAENKILVALTTSCFAQKSPESALRPGRISNEILVVGVTLI